MIGLLLCITQMVALLAKQYVLVVATELCGVEYFDVVFAPGCGQCLRKFRVEGGDTIISRGGGSWGAGSPAVFE